MVKNEIKTWAPGAFIDGPQYSHMSGHWKDERRDEERYLVRPSPKGNAICNAASPSEARWIAQRLNLASKLEQMTYDYATGKTDGSDIVRFVKSAVA